MTTTLLLVRHGETDWNRDRRWQGHADPPLNESGRDQARALARELAAVPVDAVYSSDLSRARETAEILAEPHGLDVRLDARLREVDVGEWSGLTSSEVEERYPEGFARRLAGGAGWTRGETFEELGRRVSEAVGEIAEAHRGGAVLLVTHGGAMRELWLASGGTLEERPFVSNCHVHRLAVENGAIRRID